ncbi:MAG: DUF5682 family protein [Opitutaceae bacterium]
MNQKIYGIRHHGPGCARSLLAALEAQQPDLILLESPTEAEPLLADAAKDGMNPPVAILIYQKDAPEHASFYPFAEFSPEWQSILWAQKADIPVHCFDLPATHTFGLRIQKSDTPKNPESSNDESTDSETSAECETDFSERHDPFEWFAKADGYSDGERWWNDRVEERPNSTDFFAAILEAVTALRDELKLPETDQTLRREAWMRRCMRKAKKDGFQNVAIICGAWHAPALANPPKVGLDNTLLKGMPKVKTAATWTPWTLQRLATQSGYGAGVRSPGWYDHLWTQHTHPTTTWLTKAARILRGQDLEGSSASIIEAVRLADALAGLRGRPRAGFDESVDAMQTVFCGGDATALALLQQPLFIGTAMGSLPDGISELPLQQDIEQTQRRLRLKPLAGVQDVILDLRETGGQNRSAFLHRLVALKIDWGSKQAVRTKGTFKEAWQLQWKPEIILNIIDASRFGNTLEVAASNCLLQYSDGDTLAELTKRLDLALLAKLNQAADRLIHQIDQVAATATDSADLLEAIPALVRIARYGDVRKTNTEAVQLILTHLSARANIELPAAVSGINDEAAERLGQLLRNYASAIATLENSDLLAALHSALNTIATSDAAHAGPRGIAVRILHDAAILSTEEVATLLSNALSLGSEPTHSAAWIEGFLSGSGSLLMHDRQLLGLIDQWLSELSKETFQNTLPILRRTFGSFTAPERNRIGGLIAQGNLSQSDNSAASTTLSINGERAQPAVAMVAKLLNLAIPENT